MKAKNGIVFFRLAKITTSKIPYVSVKVLSMNKKHVAFSKISETFFVKQKFRDEAGHKTL